LGAHERSDAWLRGEIEQAARAIIGRVRPRRLRKLLEALPSAQAETLRPLLTRPGNRRASRPDSPGRGKTA
ncbi:MAG: hypothetical protein O7F11_09160, partial [Acidobacteria bacterium]|nr:hypothetical protein [Acidobacteriota bacterium]